MEASSHTTDPNFIFDDFEESEYMVTAKRSSTEYAFPEDEDLGDSWMNDDMVEMDTFARHHAQMAMSTLAVYPGATFPSHTSLSALPSQPTFDTINPSLNEMYYNSEDFTKETGAVVYDANEWYHMYGNDYQAHMGLNMTDQLHSARFAYSSGSSSNVTSTTTSASSSSIYLPLATAYDPLVTSTSEPSSTSKAKSAKKSKKSSKSEHPYDTTSSLADPLSGLSKTPSRRHCSKACQHCRSSHLSCDNARPCQRCKNSGRDDCRDYVHRKRGRPRTRNPLTTTSDDLPSLTSSSSLISLPVQEI